MKHTLMILSLFSLLLFPAVGQAVKCPIPNCPAGQLCFCPPPPPTYLVVDLTAGKTKLGEQVLQRIRKNLALTGHFSFKEKFRPKSQPASKPLDQISPWYQVTLTFAKDTKNGLISLSLYKRSHPRSNRKALSWKSSMSFRLNSGDSLHKTSDLLSNQIMSRITGRPFAAFGTRIAFVHNTARGRSVIRLGKVNGESLSLGASQTLVSFSRSLNKEPLFSPSGEYLVFTSHIRYNPDLYITKIGSGKIHRISARGGVNHAPAFSPKGDLLALTLGIGGNPDIYILKSDYTTHKKWRVVRKLTSHHAIDTSPAFSPDGKKVAFVSSRKGRAQIFIKDAQKKGARAKLLFSTAHRTYTPKWCKSGAREYLAFTQLVGNKSVIFIYNMATKKGWRATSTNSPNAENPSWSPHCNLIAYESNGSKAGSKGIYISPIVGGNSMPLFAGPFTMPTWGR